MGATTFDALFGGALALEQSKDGYRFGIDSVLLGAGAPDADTMLDGGCGVGVVGLCALHLQPDARLQAVETQPQLAALAERNVERAGLGHRARVIVADLRSVELAPVDLVLLNPPFFPVRSGRRNPDPERDAARHEVYGTLPELCVAVASMLRPRGCVRTIFPARSGLRLLGALTGAGLKVCRVRPVHSFGSAPAQWLLVDARNHGRRELEVAPMLVLYDAPDRYSAAVSALLAGQRVVL